MTFKLSIPNAEAKLERANVQAERPVLAREADATYWMSRYIERTENVARLLLVSTDSLIDVRDVAPTQMERQWQGILKIMSVETPESFAEDGSSYGERVAAHMTFAKDNPNSLVSCLTRARENARGIRESISSDMWERLNRLYWQFSEESAKALFHESPHELYKSCINGTMNFQGLVDQTLPHDQRWRFTQLGRHFERITFTCRVLDEESESLGGEIGDASLRNLQWANVLRRCNSQEALRRACPGEINPSIIATFLLLEPAFPRSVRFCVKQAKESITAISSEVHSSHIDPAERILGRLATQLDYADSQELLAAGLNVAIDHILQQTARAAMAVQSAYFLH